MDLVSSTLDRYLRHRFNGLATSNLPVTASNSKTNNNSQTRIDADKRSPLNNDDDDEPNQSNETLSDDAQPFHDACDPIEIHSLSLHETMPCCVTIRDDLLYVAAGYENSQIYLWTLSDEPEVEASTSDTKPAPTQTSSTNQAEISSGTDGIKALKLKNKSRLTAHSGSVYSIQFLTDNNDLMLSCSEDTTIRLWCLKSKCNLYVYRGHNYPIWSITIASQGTYFASASMDTTARLWRFDRMCPVRIFCGHEDDVECVKFHPNAKYIATGSSDFTVRLWAISDGRMVRLMVGHKSPIVSLSFLPDGKFLASASNDGAVKIWNLALNIASNDLFVPSACKLSFSPLQEFISTCGRDNILRLWQVGQSDICERKKIDFSNRFSNIIEPQFHRDNKLFVVGLSKQSADIEHSESKTIGTIE